MTQWHPGDELPHPVTRPQKEDRRRVMMVDVETIAAVVLLLNEKPRFGPRNRRLHFDSYSLAANLSAAITKHGFKPNDPVLFNGD